MILKISFGSFNNFFLSKFRIDSNYQLLIILTKQSQLKIIRFLYFKSDFEKDFITFFFQIDNYSL